MDELLERATHPDGRKLFYPPGSHPATARTRALLACLDDVGLGEGEYASHLRDTLAAFEEGETFGKWAYLASRR